MRSRIKKLIQFIFGVPLTVASLYFMFSYIHSSRHEILPYTGRPKLYLNSSILDEFRRKSAPGTDRIKLEARKITLSKKINFTIAFVGIPSLLKLLILLTKPKILPGIYLFTSDTANK